MIPMCDVRCSVRLSSGQRLSPRKAFERRPFSLRTSGDVGRVRLKAVALVQEINVTCSGGFFFFSNWKSNCAAVPGFYRIIATINLSINASYLMRKSFQFNPIVIEILRHIVPDVAV